MKRYTVMKLAISTALVSIPTAGCAGSSAEKAGISKQAGIAEQAGVSEQVGLSKTAKAGNKNARKWAAKSEKYLSSGDIDKSVEYAEKAVEADFRNSAYRSTLAKGYIAQGRFVSAERTLQDVLDLGQSDPRTVISMALLRTSQGKTDSAVSLLNSYRDILPASDYGLALAVSGDTQNAVASLVDTVRNSNTSQIRQNLAMAYALNGQWREARIMASQDLTGEQVNKNITKWARLARPDAYRERVASLLGTQPIEDQGQPARLALDSRGDLNIDLAALAGNDQELTAVGPAPASLTDKIFGAKEDNIKVAAPETQSANIRASGDRFIIDTPDNVVKAPAQSVKVAVAASNNYSVQLGAFSSVKSANAAWDKMVKQHGVLGSFKSSNKAVKSKGRTLYRLSATGFGNKASAESTCSRIKSKGGSCIVRVKTVSAPTGLASSQTAKIASRK